MMVYIVCSFYKTKINAVDQMGKPASSIYFTIYISQESLFTHI